MQTKKQSLIESFTNVAIGYIISLLSLFIIFPILGIESSPSKNFIITFYFTVISIFRSYIIRRYFNKKLKLEKEIKELENYTTYLENKNKFNNYIDSFSLESPKWLGGDKAWNIFVLLSYMRDDFKKK
jgi:hypothetical protein